VSRTRKWLLGAAVAVLAAAAGLAFQLWGPGLTGTREPAPAQAVFAVQLPDLQGRVQGLSQWRGRVLVINFWATWCAPCREEIPVFVRMQERHGPKGLQFVGIAIDRPEQVAAFAREFGINYPVLLGGLDTMELMRQTGNRPGVLPFTLVLDRSGRITSQTLGEIKEVKLENVIQPLL